ncbi:calmodulin-binding protein 25-like [Oryza brachyantha]|uniref:calmodulin-binding protein 25-like n=1 Tax=Oryza brachyantha TaxID=4533 RepID=UPI001ADAF5C0|nr:calmodulin-binding protein 25-like [Oryza brachyantha]
MDAASCVGVAPAALLSRSFADAAIARALHFSLCDHSPLPEPTATHQSVATDVDLGAVQAVPAVAALPPRAAQSSPSPSATRCCRLGPAGGGRAGKRRPRPSKRTPTTYISTDAATFRIMVQQVTGAQVEPLDDACLGLLMPPPFDVIEPALLPADAAACVGAAHVPAAYVPHPLHAAAAAVAAAEQPCFPTLDSWNVMYGGKDEVV